MLGCELHIQATEGMLQPSVSSESIGLSAGVSCIFGMRKTKGYGHGEGRMYITGLVKLFARYWQEELLNVGHLSCEMKDCWL